MFDWQRRFTRKRLARKKAATVKIFEYFSLCKQIKTKSDIAKSRFEIQTIHLSLIKQTNKNKTTLENYSKSNLIYNS